MCAAKIKWLSSARNEEKYIENLRGLSVKDEQKKNGDDAITDVHIKPSAGNSWRKKFHEELVESAPDIDNQRRNPTSPLYSARTFPALNLKPELLKGVYNMGYSRPSKIQELALPTLFADPPQNLIAQAQSGTGKTAAYLLAMLNRVDPSKNYPQALCLAPTYELAIQIGEFAAQMARFNPKIKIIYSVRGEAFPMGSNITEHVIVGTPGKTLDWSLKFKFFDLSKIKAFVLDEADVMIDIQGHQDQCLRMHRKLSSDCQMMFFSATYSEKVLDFAELIVDDPVIIKVKREEQCLNSIKQYYVLCKSEEEKYTAITNIYASTTVGQAIFFRKTKKSVTELAAKLTNAGHVVGLLSSELTVEQRLLVLDRFRNGEMRVLVTTDVLSRGIDIPAVTMVVNYDLPVDVVSRDVAYETYLHRIGRTGRFGLPGIAINLVDSETALAMCKQIENHFNTAIKYLDTDNDEEVEAIGEK